MAKLELLVSPPGTGKTSHCIDIFRNEILKSKAGIDSRAYFILPNREHASRIQSLILKKKIPGLFNAHILTIDDLTDSFLGGRALFRPTDVLRQFFLASILEQSPKAWKYFENVKSFKGFHRLLAETVQEFKANLLTVQAFEAAAKPLLPDPVLGPKALDFMELMRRYEAKLEAMGFAEPEDNIRRLLSEQALLEKTSLLIFDGFYHFTKAQRALIQAAARRAQHIVVTLTLGRAWKRRLFVFEYPDRTRTFLKSIGFKESRTKFSVDHRTHKTALKHLEKNVFHPKALRFSVPQEAIQIFEADNTRGEMEMIAREIRKIHLEQPVHFSDICIIFRALGGSQKILEQVFSEYEIPVHVHERKKLLETGWARLVHRWSRLTLDGWKREDLFFLLRSSYRLLPSAEKPLAEFEHAAFSQNLLEGRQLWADLSAGTKFKGVISDFIQTLLDVENRLQSCQTLREWVVVIREHLRRWLPSEGLLFEQDELSWLAIQAILRQMEISGALEKTEPMPPKAMMEQFQRSIESGLFSCKPSGKNRVQVYDVVMALPKEYKVVFIVGLLEKSFPKEVLEDALWKDEEREKLSRHGACLESRLARLSGEKYFFYMALTRARERLYLSYPLKDSEGRPSLPSFFLEEAQKCFSDRSLPVLSSDPQNNLLSKNWRSRQEAERGAAFGLFQTTPKALEPKERSLYHWLVSEWPSLREVLECGLRSEQAVLSDPKVLDAFKRLTGPLSATRLETYVTCAFKYFSHKILALEPPPDGRERMDMGSLLHEVLEDFYKGLSPEQRKSAPFWEQNDAVENELLNILEKAINKKGLDYLPLYRRKVIYGKMKEALVLFALREKELFKKRALVPTYFELDFGRKLGGENAEHPFLKLGEDVSIEGKIDRVDVDNTQKKALVVDYKLGKKNIHKKMKQGLELQMPIYLLAMQRLLGFDVLGAELRFLEKNQAPEGLYLDASLEILGLGSRKKCYSSEELSATLQSVERRIVEAVHRLRAGDISVKSKSCEHCDYQPVCRFEPWKLVYDGVESDEGD